MDEDQVAEAIRTLATTICPDTTPSPDAAGGYVASATEGLMGVTKALTMVADAIDGAGAEVAGAIEDLASAVREGRGPDA